MKSKPSAVIACGHSYRVQQWRNLSRRRYQSDGGADRADSADEAHYEKLMRHSAAQAITLLILRARGPCQLIGLGKPALINCVIDPKRERKADISPI